MVKFNIQCDIENNTSLTNYFINEVFSLNGFDGNYNSFKYLVVELIGWWK